MVVLSTIWKVFLSADGRRPVSLHNYLEEILGSKASIRVLKTLVRYRGKVFTIRELAKTAGISHPEVSLVVKNLEKRGVLKIQLVGRAQQVTLNEDSYILKSMVEPSITAEEKTMGDLVSTIRPFFEDKRISSAAIFGSAARGVEKNLSDIDLLVVSNDKEFASDCAAKANAAVSSRFGVDLSPLIVDEAFLNRRKSRNLTSSILESHIRVWGREIAEVMKK